METEKENSRYKKSTRLKKKVKAVNCGKHAPSSLTPWRPSSRNANWKVSLKQTLNDSKLKVVFWKFLNCRGLKNCGYKYQYLCLYCVLCKRYDNLKRTFTSRFEEYNRSEREFGCVHTAVWRDLRKNCEF